MGRRCGGKHRKGITGINLLTLLWTDGKALMLCAFRVYDKPIGGNTKNEHFLAML
jgi:putative transposase